MQGTYCKYSEETMFLKIYSNTWVALNISRKLSA